ncbi:MAG: GIY-YIG nuclease family protein [Gammaproteobacteria bacterium]|nr:GIY-YIG nuclease family protein [Gammaproteobacteria bacterium]
MMCNWYVYMVRCSDATLYTGITTDMPRRLQQHNGEVGGGARYTQGRRPVVVVYLQRCESRAVACRREWQIKQLGRDAKERLIAEKNNPRSD